MHRLFILLLVFLSWSPITKGQAYPGFYSEVELYFDQSANKLAKMNVSEMILIAKIRMTSYSNNDSLVIEQDTLVQIGIDIDGVWKYLVQARKFVGGDPVLSVSATYDTTYVDCKKKFSCTCAFSKTDTITCDEKGRIKERMYPIAKFSYYYDEKNNLAEQIGEYNEAVPRIIASSHRYSASNRLESISYYQWDKVKGTGTNEANLFFTYNKEGDLQSSRYEKMKENVWVPWRTADLEYTDGLLTAIHYREADEVFTFLIAYKFRDR